MSRRAASFVLGYHGCDDEVAKRVVSGRNDVHKSDRSYDWLGSGAYFWESDPIRALEWAQLKVSRGKYKKAAVVGAIIDLRNCLDLVSRDDIELLKEAHYSFIQMCSSSGLEVPKNKNIDKSDNDDGMLRYLDCAVIDHLHGMISTPFDTVRGLFIEGDKIFEGSGAYEKSHVQIAVRNLDCIIGYFYPKDLLVTA